MRIVIVGAGSAGKNLAVRIGAMGHDLIVIDRDPGALTEVTAEMDVLAMEGTGSSPGILEGVDLARTDLFVAVTSSDEVNLLACHCARKGGAEHTIARLSDASYRHSPLLDLKAFGVDHAMSHKEQGALEIFSVLNLPGSIEATRLFDGKVAAVGVVLPGACPLLDKPLAEFRDEPWFGKVRFMGRVRNGKTEIPGGATVLQEGDDLYTVLPAEATKDFMDWILGGKRPEFKKVIIAGGSDLGLSLARLLEKTSLETVLIERNRERAERISELLERCLVIHGDAAHAATLKEIGMDVGTAFAAVTGDEEMNIVSCIQAKELGARFTVSRIDTPEYVPIVDKLRLLDRVISPYLSLIRAILSYLRGATVLDVGLFNHIAGELQEVVIEAGDAAVERPLSSLRLPRGALVAAVRRGDETFIPTGEFVFLAGDRIAVFSLPGTAPKLRSIFQ